MSLRETVKRKWRDKKSVSKTILPKNLKTSKPRHNQTLKRTFLKLRGTFRHKTIGLSRRLLFRSMSWSTFKKRRMPLPIRTRNWTTNFPIKYRATSRSQSNNLSKTRKLRCSKLKLTFWSHLWDKLCKILKKNVS